MEGPIGNVLVGVFQIDLQQSHQSAGDGVEKRSALPDKAEPAADGGSVLGAIQERVPVGGCRKIPENMGFCGGSRQTLAFVPRTAATDHPRSVFGGGPEPTHEGFLD